MQHIKIFEDFARELFGFPIFSEWVYEEDDDKFTDLVYPILEPFQGEYFQLDEPSKKFTPVDPQKLSDFVCQFYITVSSLRDLNRFNRFESDPSQKIVMDEKEINILEKAFPSEVRPYGTTEKLFGVFYWYSYDYREKKSPYDQIWMVAKNDNGKFKCANGNIGKVMEEWINSEREFDDLESLVKDQEETLREIGKRFNTHLEGPVEAFRRENEEQDPY